MSSVELRHLHKSFGNFEAIRSLDIKIAEGEFFTILGPSGCGKTTCLRIIAGFISPTSGRVLLGGRDVTGQPPYRRNVGMVFQSYALFPHLSAARNVAFGLEARKVGRGELERRVDEALALVQLENLRDRLPHELSGGQKQRVALARAIAIRPEVLLLDEPLSALDEKIRRTMQTELKHVHFKTGTTFLYVTHDQEEALTMSDRIAVFNRGACVECDAPEPLYKRPRTRFVAGFFRGCNVLRAERVEKSGARVSFRVAGLMIDGVHIQDRGATVGDHIALRAENVYIGPDAASRECHLNTVLLESTYRGTVVDYRLELSDGQQLLAMTTRHVDLPSGSRVSVGFDRDAIIPLAD